MYVPDSTAWLLGGTGWRVLAIGWLEYDHLYPTGKVSLACKLKLAAILRDRPYMISMGSYRCTFCEHGVELSRLQKWANLLPFVNIPSIDPEIKTYDQFGSNIFIVVQPKTKVIYRMPTLISHYIIKHEYQPPEQFLEALLEQPPRDSPAYKQALEALNHKELYMTAEEAKRKF
jgi:hypothetical protein